MQRTVGVDVGGTHISAGLVSGSRILKHAEISTPKTRQDFIAGLFGIIESVIDSKTKSIGIGFPAPIINGKAFEVQNMPYLNNLDIKSIIEKKFGKKCFVENDANVFALAEQRFGAAKGKMNVVGITLGTGIGCGIIINGKIYSGNTGAAGEISKIPARGKRLEDYVNAKFIKRISGKEPKELGKSKAWKSFGKNIGTALSVIVDTLDPEMIVLGGKISNAYRFFSSEIRPEIKKNAFRITASKVKIAKSKLKNSGVIGAACLCC